MRRKDALGTPIRPAKRYVCIQSGAVALPDKPLGEVFHRGMVVLGEHRLLQSPASVYFIPADMRIKRPRAR
jgi:hypothetical protein